MSFRRKLGIIGHKVEYKGDFKDDKYHGKGELIYPNGTTYKGNFEHGKASGKVLVTGSKGRTEERDFGVRCIPNNSIRDIQSNCVN